MPVLKHYQGNCHVYVDARCDLDMAVKIIVNAKVQRPGVCNAAETLLVHQAIAPAFLPRAAEALMREGVELRGDAAARQIVPAMKPAEPADWDTEYLDKILAVAVVESIDEAIAHITRHGSGHTEAIVTADLAAAQTIRRRGRQLGRDGQRQHPLQRRRPARPGRRDRHQHRQDPRPRALRPARADQHQMDRRSATARFASDQRFVRHRCRAVTVLATAPVARPCVASTFGAFRTSSTNSRR